MDADTQMLKQVNELARRLYEYRVGQGLSREKVAGKLGVTGSTVYRWEKGLASPKGLYEEKLKQFLRKVETRPSQEAGDP